MRYTERKEKEKGKKEAAALKYLKKGMAAGLTIVLLLLMFTGCFGSSSGGASVQSVSRQIGVCLPNDTDAFWADCAAELQKALSSGGHTVNIYYAQDDADKQAEQIKEAAAAGCRAVLLAPADTASAALSEAVDAMAEQTVKVISFYNLLFNSQGLTAYVTYDLIGAGRQAATQLAVDLGLTGGKTATVELITTPMADGVSADNWYNGAMGVLRPYIAGGQLVIRSKENNSASSFAADQNAAAARYTRLFEQYGAPDAVLCTSDIAAQGVMDAVEALQAKGVETSLPILTGYGSLDRVNRVITDGGKLSTAYGETASLCSSAAALAVAVYDNNLALASDTVSYYNGKKIVATCAVATVSVNSDNYPDTLVASGRLEKAASTAEPSEAVDQAEPKAA